MRSGVSEAIEHSASTAEGAGEVGNHHIQPLAIRAGRGCQGHSCSQCVQACVNRGCSRQSSSQLAEQGVADGYAAANLPQLWRRHVARSPVNFMCKRVREPSCSKPVGPCLSHAVYLRQQACIAIHELIWQADCLYLYARDVAWGAACGMCIFSVNFRYNHRMISKEAR